MLQGRVCRRETSDRHTERGAGNIVVADQVTPFNGTGITAVLTANAHFQIRAGLAALGNRPIHEFADTAAIQGFTVKGAACPGLFSIVDDIELTTTGGTTLRYDSAAGQFIQNWQTPKKPGACYTVTMTTPDGSAISANVKLK